MAPLPSPTARLDTLRRAPFFVTDVLRRTQATALGRLGLGPTECPYRELARGPRWRLRDYGGEGTPAVLVVAAPIKRPYIWDLTPSTSALRRLLQRRHVYLLEWLPATHRHANLGLDDYMQAMEKCVTLITSRTAGISTAQPFLIGHSLGGTLAAIFACSAPESARGLVLLGAPLCFEPGTSRFRDALTSLVPTGMSEKGPFPGSLLSHVSALAAPETFVWSRLWDAAASSADFQALELHARVERWALDEVALPSKLVSQIIEWLYREDRLCRGVLQIAGSLVSPARLSVPTLAVVNSADQIAPLASIRPFLDAVPSRSVRVLEYRGEVGVCLQHLGILIGRDAHARLWPEILSWLESPDAGARAAASAGSKGTVRAATPAREQAAPGGERSAPS